MQFRSNICWRSLISQKEPIVIDMNNKLVIAFKKKNQVFHDQSKYINTINHFIREYGMKNEVKLEFVMSHD